MVALVISILAILWTPVSTQRGDSQPVEPPVVAEPSTTAECVTADSSGFDEQRAREYAQITYPPAHFEGVEDGMTYEQRIETMIDVARSQCANPDGLLSFLALTDAPDEIQDLIRVGCPEAVADEMA